MTTTKRPNSNDVRIPRFGPTGNPSWRSTQGTWTVVYPANLNALGAPDDMGVIYSHAGSAFVLFDDATGEPFVDDDAKVGLTTRVRQTILAMRKHYGAF